MEKVHSVSFLAIEYAKNGDMLGPFMKGACMPESLARTFFQHIIEAVSYMHNCGVAHMDLKLDNILIDDEFNPKVIDFDVSQEVTDAKQFGSGTVVYRAPEVKDRKCTNYIAADIYSLGVILFVMVSGYPPYEEKQRERNGPWVYSRDYTLMRNNNARYWEREAKARGSRSFFTKEFIDIVNWMLTEDPEKRPSMEELKNHDWYKGFTLEGRNYREEMKKFMVSSC
jgi:serine/threonine protein kinase